MLMVVRGFGNRIHELGAVWDHTAVKGETSLVRIRIVGHGVVGGRLLGHGHGHQHQQHQGRHDDEWGGEQEMEEETESVNLIQFIFV